MAHTKIITPGSQDFREPVMTQIKLARGGLRGGDLQAFVKRASVQFVDKLASLRFAPGEVPVHLIAVGATEFYGPNRNGDGFKEATCREFHPTFQKYARWYRNHCFVAGTPVVMGDRTRQPIETILEGTLVATHDGPRKVTNVFCNHYSGTGYRFTVMGVPTSFTATAEHPILILRREDVHCRHKYSRLQPGGCRCHHKPCRGQQLRVVPQYVNAEDVRIDDYMLISQPRCGQRRMRKAFAELVGWIASEGYIGARGSLQFTFSAKNSADIAAVTACLQANDLHVGRTDRDDGLVQLSSCSKEVSAQLRKYVVGTKSDKHLTAAVMTWNPTALRHLLTAYIDGDGCVSRGRRAGLLRIRSSSPQMLYILSDIVRALGLPLNINYDVPPAPMVSPTNGKTYQGRGSGVVAVAAAHADALCIKSRKRHRRMSKRAPAVQLYAGYHLARVQCIDKVQLDEPVYNLEVDGVHQYMANEVLVHNCNKDTTQGRGMVKASAYNDAMHRIELLVALNGTKEAADRNHGLVADEEMEKLAKGEAISVSMACICAGTLVKVRHGFRVIEDIREGDEVLTHLGRYCRVYAVTPTQRDELVHISPKYSGRQVVSATPDHKFWVARWRDIPTCRESAERCKRSQAFRRKHRHELYTYARMIPCGELLPDDLLLMPIPCSSGETCLSARDARLLGYYMAEGSMMHLDGICITCNKQDAVVNEIKALAYDATSIGYDKHTASAQAYNIRVYSPRLAQQCLQLIGRGVRNKRIPQEIYNAPAEFKLEFLAAWFNGDGWQDYKGMHWSTCSRTLSIELQMLLAQLGMPASVCRIDHITDLPDRPRAIPGIEYVVNISNRYTAAFTVRSKAKLVEVVGHGHGHGPFITGNFLAFPIARVRCEKTATTVYDISVRDDETFTAFGYAISNCRVKHDVCSGCGNKAKSRDEYCGPDLCKYGGCRDNLAKTFEDGHTLHVDNPDPVFFDISNVFRPADRIAYTLGRAHYRTKHAEAFEEMAKAAADHQFGVEKRASSSMAARLGITAPLWLYDDGPWADPRIVGQMKIANELINLETKIGGEARNERDRAFLKVVYPAAFDTPTVHKGPIKLAHVVTALAHQKCMLPVLQFITLLTGECTTKTANAADRVAERLPGVYNRLASDPQLEEALRSNPYLPTGAVPTKMAHWALNHAAEWSLDRPRVIERLQLSVLRQPDYSGERREMTKVATVDGTEELAKQYALYQIGFLYNHSADPDAGFLQEMAVRSNFVR
jgi:hypothetical protein